MTSDEQRYRRAFYAVYWPARARGASPAEATAQAEAATSGEGPCPHVRCPRCRTTFRCCECHGRQHGT